jgi:hypothetical protein
MNNRRRIFLKSSLFLVGTLPLFADNSYVYAKKISIYKEPYQTFTLLHQDLFFGSSIYNILNNINAVSFLAGVFEDPYISEDDKLYLKNGIIWLHETSSELYNKKYYNLTALKRQKVLHVISKKEWGESWLWSVMSYFFEAMLGDSIYGGNRDKAGWKYLNIVSGYPRPKKILYNG